MPEGYNAHPRVWLWDWRCRGTSRGWAVVVMEAPEIGGFPVANGSFRAGLGSRPYVHCSSDEALAAWDGGEEPVRLGPDDDFARLENGCRDVDAPEREIEREIKRLRSTHALWRALRAA